MTKYEVTTFIEIPVSIVVEADTPAEALEKGTDDLYLGLGVQGDQYWRDEFDVWDVDNDRPANHQIGLGELRQEVK